MSKGQLIVIDGADGAGKATQTRMLVERLRAEGRVVETMDFPQYTQNTFGKLIRECLDGARGDFLQVDSRIASTLYAADRFESKETIKGWLDAGSMVILDRYVSSNMLHQGAKLTNPEELESFLVWLDHIEHEIFGVPRPERIVYLDVPLAVRATLMAQSVAAQKHGQGTKLDLAEMDVSHQEAAESRAKQIIELRNNWVRIECVREGALRTADDIHEEVYARVQ